MMRSTNALKIMKRGITVTDEKRELEEIKSELKNVQAHSKTWEILKFQAEQTAKDRVRQWIINLILVILLAASNGVWIYLWFSYDFSTTEIIADQDGNGVNVVGGGDIDYGAESTNSQAYTH